MERWAPIWGYTGIYSVSTEGRVRIEVTRQNIRAGKILRLTSAGDGYLLVRLSKKGKQHDAVNRVIGRLVLSAFDRRPRAGEQANHRDGDIKNNTLTNLEWTSPASNVRHSIEVLGHHRQGEQNPAARMTEARVLELRVRAVDGEPYEALGLAFGVTGAMARLIATGAAWSHVGGPLAPPRVPGRRPKR